MPGVVVARPPKAKFRCYTTHIKAGPGLEPAAGLGALGGTRTPTFRSVAICGYVCYLPIW